MHVVNFVQREEDINNQPESVVTTNSTIYNKSSVNMQVVNETNTVNEVRESIESVLKNEAIKEQAIINAQDINKKMNSNWFSVDQLMKKTKMKGIQQVHDLLNLLCLFQLAYREDKGGIIKYKITLNIEARKMLLEQELAEARAKVTYLENEITKLNFINN